MTGEVVEIPVDCIGPGVKVRTEWLDLDHVRLLEPVIDQVPAITVTAAGAGRYRVEDGNHRLAAAKAVGRSSIRAVVVELGEMEAIEFAAKANRGHGKPFTMSELTAIAKRLIAGTDWSDRRIAEACGLSATTVGGLRPPTRPLPAERSTVQAGQLNKTIGADGKARPATKGVAERNRERVREAITAKPDASTRQIAAEVGVSNATVAAVRNESSRPTPLTIVAPPTNPDTTVAEVATITPIPGKWSKHLDHSNAARELGRFLDRRLLRNDEDVAVLADGCPADWRERVATAAREMANEWRLLSEHLQQPTQLKGVR